MTEIPTILSSPHIKEDLEYLVAWHRLRAYDPDETGACPICQGNNPDCPWCEGTGVPDPQQP